MSPTYLVIHAYVDESITQIILYDTKLPILYESYENMQNDILLFLFIFPSYFRFHSCYLSLSKHLSYCQATQHLTLSTHQLARRYFKTNLIVLQKRPAKQFKQTNLFTITNISQIGDPSSHLTTIITIYDLIRCL